MLSKELESKIENLVSLHSEVENELKKEIQALSKDGYSYRHIERDLGISYGLIKKIILIPEKMGIGYKSLLKIHNSVIFSAQSDN